MTLLIYFTLLNLIDILKPGSFNWFIMSTLGIIVWVGHLVRTAK